MSGALRMERNAGWERGGRDSGPSCFGSKCENLHFYLLIYLTDRPLKQPSINKRHASNE